MNLKNSVIRLARSLFNLANDIDGNFKYIFSPSFSFNI